MATYKIPWFLWNLQVNYHVGKCIPLVPTLCQINQVHTLPSYFLKTYFNIILTPTYIKEFQVGTFPKVFLPKLWTAEVEVVWCTT